MPPADGGPWRMQLLRSYGTACPNGATFWRDASHGTVSAGSRADVIGRLRIRILQGDARAFRRGVVAFLGILDAAHDDLLGR
jgi:hypothetical protein